LRGKDKQIVDTKNILHKKTFYFCSFIISFS